MEYPKSFEELMTCFKMLPGIGNKGAERMAYAIYDMSEEDVKRFSQALTSFKENVHTCPICGNLSEGDKCEICADQERDQSTICVVESPKDVFAMEKMKEYHGLYHVLGGTISIMDGKTMDDLNIMSWKQVKVYPSLLNDNNILFDESYFKDAEGNEVVRSFYEFVRDHLGYRLNLQSESTVEA